MRVLFRGALGVALAFAVPAAAQNAANGETLYFQYCNECHGFPPLGGPQNAGNKPNMIRGAIEFRVARMRFLSFLSDAQLADIAAFIARTVNRPPRPARDYTGLWFDPDESGWGLKLSQHVASGDTVFGLLFVYEAPGKPAFLSLPTGQWTTPTTFTGTLYRTSGPPPTEAFDPARVTVRAVGTLTIAFDGADSATLTYTHDGAAVTRRLMPFRY